jgi:hypothetical protein
MELPDNPMDRPEGDWDLIHGELMTFANPAFDLPPTLPAMESEREGW